jgi:hypothetical protein
MGGRPARRRGGSGRVGANVKNWSRNLQLRNKIERVKIGMTSNIKSDHDYEYGEILVPCGTCKAHYEVKVPGRKPWITGDRQVEKIVLYQLDNMEDGDEIVVQKRPGMWAWSRIKGAYQRLDIADEEDWTISN